MGSTDVDLPEREKDPGEDLTDELLQMQLQIV